MGRGAASSPWRSPRIILTLTLVFLTGSAAGALGMRYGLHFTSNKSTPAWKEGGKEVSLQMFRRELNLTDQQAEEIKTVLDDFVMYYQTLQQQMDDVRANGKERILKILNEDQKTRFDKMMTDLQSKQIH